MNPRKQYSLYLLYFFTSLFLIEKTTLADALVDDYDIRLDKPADVTNKRQALIDFIWGTEGFPRTKLPSSFERNAISPVHNLAHLARVDTLHFSMDRGLEGLAHHFIPENANNRLVVLHHGHACTFNDGPGSGNLNYGMQTTIDGLLFKGFSVLAVYMPHMRPGDCRSQSHAQMFNFFTTGSPMKFFLEPVAASLNYMKIYHPNYKDFSMIGLSGGAWTTTVYAAIDQRIKFSFQIAGTLPLYLRYEGYNHDKEQFLPEFYKIAGYLDLYTLGSAGVGRKQIQILNRHDNCCYGENQHNAALAGESFDTTVRGYEIRVKDVLSHLNSGSFRVYIDEVAPSHMISENALTNVIFPVLNGTEDLASTIRSVRGGNLCVDIPDYGRPPRDGDPIQVYQCHGKSNQQFRILEDGTIRALKQENLCLTVFDRGRPPQQGDALQVFPCKNAFNQRFSFLPNGTIHPSQASQLCLAIPDGGQPPKNGARVQTLQCGGTSSQQWSINR